MKIGANLLTCNNLQHPELLEATRATVLSLRDSELALQPHCFCVVDNGSSDGTLGWLADQFPSPPHRVFALERNFGIAKARNVGARWLMDEAGCDLILEIHNDMVFPRQWLWPLLKTLEQRPRCGMVMPSLIVGRPVLGAPVLRLEVMRPWRDQRNLVELKAEQVVRPGVIRPGLQHPALKRVSMLREVGLYDEFFEGRNFEDTDEIYRMCEAGWEYLVNFGSAVWHAYSFSFAKLGPEMPLSVNERIMQAKWKESVPWGAKLAQEMEALYV